MKTYYCVTSSFDNYSRVAANITTSVEAESKPDNSFHSTCEQDVYNDWFENIEDAKKYVKDAQRA